MRILPGQNKHLDMALQILLLAKQTQLGEINVWPIEKGSPNE